MTIPLIELEHVTRLYGTVIGVNDISITLPPGAHGLLGPNGAGKSTLLNLLTGQLSPTIGSVRVLGYQPRSSREMLRRIGYLPGSEGMYADVSAIEWVTYLARIQGYHRAESRSRAERALERVQLTAHMHRKISTFSRGMRQRTRLAQAIAHEPDFLILDEPFSGLDPIARHVMITLLQDWIAEGKSLLVSSHVLFEIESLTKSFLLITGGRLLASGTADELHALLSELPCDYHLRVDRPRQLAAELISAGIADEVTVHDDDQLSIRSRSTMQLTSYLSEAMTTKRYFIRELRSGNESLQDVFHALMKIHRGAL